MVTYKPYIIYKPPDISWWLSPTPLKNDGLRQLDDEPIWKNKNSLKPTRSIPLGCAKKRTMVKSIHEHWNCTSKYPCFYVSPFLWGQWGSQWSWRHVITHPTSRPSLWVDGIKDMLNEGQLSAQHMIRSTCRVFFLTQPYCFQQFWYSYHIHEAIYYLERVTMWHLERVNVEKHHIQQM